MRFILFASILIATLVLAPVTAVLAHSPVFPGQNHDLSTAYEIDDPAKSWAIYKLLEDEGSADYYKFMVSKGERIQVALIVPDSPSESGFLPSFTLIGPGITQHDSVPDYLEVPPGYGTIVVDGIDTGKAVYEPFTPSRFYEVGALTTNAPNEGIYYIAVFNSELHDDTNNHVHESNGYAIIVGYVEEFTPLELILIPYRVHEIYLWEGQSWFTIFLPLLLVIVVGGVVFFWRSKRVGYPKGISKWLATLGGLTFIGTAAGTIYQMVLALNYTGLTVEAFITVLIAIVSIVIGVIALWYALRSKSILTLLRRTGLIIIGLVALFTWSGLYLGPALLITAAIIPPYIINKKVSSE